MRARLVLLVGILAVACSACAQRNCVPESIVKAPHLIDLGADPSAHAPVGKGLTREVEAEFRRRGAQQHPPSAAPYHLLALSGGGMYGSFGIGVLNGWTESGTRPQFDVVTGISTGALMATFAYLGPAYDRPLRESMVGVQQSEILRRRSLAILPFADAFFTSRPMARKIEHYLTPQILHEVAAAHATGRRLYVGTTNLDTRQLVIWDMGAIAARGTTESCKLYRDIVLASCSIPGAFPPVRIPVQVDGKWYEELHVDGGASDEVMFRAFMVADLNRAAGTPCGQAPVGSTLYVINNGKLYVEPKCVRPRMLPMANAAFRSIVYAKSRDELYRIYLNCLETGVQFRMTSVPQDMPMGESRGLALSREDQERLYAVGAEIGRQCVTGAEWKDLPPGTDLTEQAMPRTGVRFATPAGAAGACPPGPSPR